MGVSRPDTAIDFHARDALEFPCLLDCEPHFVHDFGCLRGLFRLSPFLPSLRAFRSSEATWGADSPSLTASLSLSLNRRRCILSSLRISQMTGTRFAGRCHLCFVSAFHAFTKAGLTVRPSRLVSSAASFSSFMSRESMAHFSDLRRRVSKSSVRGFRVVSKIDIAAVV